MRPWGTKALGLGFRVQGYFMGAVSWLLLKIVVPLPFKGSLEEGLFCLGQAGEWH